MKSSCQNQFVVIRGRRFEYQEIRGDATRAPVVFLHEGLGSVSLWRGFPRAVAECTGRRALIYSRLGHRFSDSPSAPRTPDFTHEEARAILPLLLDAWHADAPVLIGHSDGASIALIHATENPVTALVCLAPHVFVEDTCLDSIREAKASFDRGALRERMARHHRDVDACFYGWNDVWLHSEFPRWNIEGLLSAIVVPAPAHPER